jgi:hypothetical protein
MHAMCLGRIVLGLNCLQDIKMKKCVGDLFLLTRKLCVCVRSDIRCTNTTCQVRVSLALTEPFFPFFGQDNISRYYLLAAVLMSRTNVYDYRL